MRRLTLLPVLALSTPALAGSISAPGTIGGPDSNAATPNPAAIHYNPAAIGASEGVNLMADVQMAFIRVDATTTRNGGIDPYSGEAYNTAQARVQVPVALLGATWQVVPDWVTVGFAVTDSFVGGGDYRSGDPAWEDEQLSEGEDWQSHQRYAGIMTKVITIHLIPAVAISTPIGLHVGGGFKYILDTFEAIQASDPFGTEGSGNLSGGGSYATDTILQGELSGGHIGWSAGLFYDKFEKAQVGLSLTDNGTFYAEGEGTLDVPGLFTTDGADKVVPANLDFTVPLPMVVQFWVNSQINEQLNVGAGFEGQLWAGCCGSEDADGDGDIDGDIMIGVHSTSGEGGLGSADGLLISPKETQYSPRRLENSFNFAANAGYQISDKLWAGGRAAFNQNAVPDYAVSATNLDFQSVGAQAALRVKPTQALEVGLSYAKFFTFEREITNSAWDVRDTADADYVDEYFSPALPYKASTNGTFKSKVDIVGVRVSAAF